jgi:hypothetical protein
LNFLVQSPLSISIKPDDGSCSVNKVSSHDELNASGDVSSQSGVRSYRRKFTSSSSAAAAAAAASTNNDNEVNSSEFLHLVMSVVDQRNLWEEVAEKKSNPNPKKSMEDGEGVVKMLPEMKVKMTPVVRRIQNLPIRLSSNDVDDDNNNDKTNNSNVDVVMRCASHPSTRNVIQYSDRLPQNGGGEWSADGFGESMGVFWSGQLHHEFVMASQLLPTTTNTKTNTTTTTITANSMKVGVCFTEPGLFAIGAKCEYSFNGTSSHTIFSSSPQVIAVRDMC